MIHARGAGSLKGDASKGGATIAVETRRKGHGSARHIILTRSQPISTVVYDSATWLGFAGVSDPPMRVKVGEIRGLERPAELAVAELAWAVQGNADPGVVTVASLPAAVPISPGQVAGQEEPQCGRDLHSVGETGSTRQARCATRAQVRPGLAWWHGHTQRDAGVDAVIMTGQTETQVGSEERRKGAGNRRGVVHGYLSTLLLLAPLSQHVSLNMWCQDGVPQIIRPN